MMMRSSLGGDPLKHPKVIHSRIPSMRTRIGIRNLPRGDQTAEYPFIA
jgi:hypothetical protein